MDLKIKINSLALESSIHYKIELMAHHVVIHNTKIMPKDQSVAYT
jgi:hypothetical protein